MAKLRVIKLGGSLLTLSDLNERFQRWCDDNPHPMSLIIVGGGGLVDAVRDIDRIHRLPDSFSHWLCIDLLRHTARLAHQILSHVDIYETQDRLREALSQSGSPSTASVTAIVQVNLFFQRNYPNMVLPESWDITSDSIAAAFAQTHAADELVVMKSADYPEDDSRVNQVVTAGFVDRYFDELSASVARVRFINLRAGGLPNEYR